MRFRSVTAAVVTLALLNLVPAPAAADPVVDEHGAASCYGPYCVITPALTVNADADDASADARFAPVCYWLQNVYDCLEVLVDASRDGASANAPSPCYVDVQPLWPLAHSYACSLGAFAVVDAANLNAAAYGRPVCVVVGTVILPVAVCEYAEGSVHADEDGKVHYRFRALYRIVDGHVP